MTIGFVPRKFLETVGNCQWRYAELADGGVCLDGVGVNQLTLPSVLGGKTVTRIERLPNVPSVVIPSGVVSLDCDFGSSSCLSWIDVEEANSEFTGFRGVLYNKNGTRLVRCPPHLCAELDIPDMTTEIGDSAFAYCVSFLHIVLPKQIRKIGYRAFAGCACMKDIHLPNGVSEIGSGAFVECKGLTHIAIPDMVAVIRRETFKGCITLRSLHIGDGVRRIEEDAFAESGLRSVFIPAGVEYISPEAFTGSDMIAFEVSADNPVYSSRNGLLCDKQGERVVCIPHGASEVVIPSGVKTVGYRAGYGAFKLTELVLPGSVCSIDEEAFGQCDNLRAVSIPNSVQHIGQSAFVECRSLREVSLPQGLDSIESDAFGVCVNLDFIRRRKDDGEGELIFKGSEWYPK